MVVQVDVAEATPSAVAMRSSERRAMVRTHEEQRYGERQQRLINNSDSLLRDIRRCDEADLKARVRIGPRVAGGASETQQRETQKKGSG